ncbi:MAG: glycosyltransferase [Planctomycetota bacterium]
MTAVSLIISTRNRASRIGTCLDALPTEGLVRCGFELILVDNGSNDGTGDIMRAFAAERPYPAQVIVEPEPGLSHGRNAGIRAARGEIIAFTDDDCYPAPDYADAIVETFTTRRIDYCGGRILLHDPTDAQYIINTRETPRTFGPGSIIRPGRIQGANMIFRRSVVERVGLFDPQMAGLDVMRCEDVDYCTRASLCGFTGAHVPSIVVQHHHGRKPGPDLDALKRDNQISLGAHYMKFWMLGYRRALLAYLGVVLHRRNPAEVGQHLQGARAYRRIIRTRGRSPFDALSVPLQTEWEGGAP